MYREKGVVAIEKGAFGLLSTKADLHLCIQDRHSFKKD